jgi:hypothetical protein
LSAPIVRVNWALETGGLVPGLAAEINDAGTIWGDFQKWRFSRLDVLNAQCFELDLCVAMNEERHT